MSSKASSEMVAPAFGFSAGDFIAAVDLFTKAAKALRKSSGATASYQQAVSDLELLATVLQKVDQLSATPFDPGVHEKIRVCSLQCRIPLTRFLAKIRKYEAQLDWSLGNKERVIPKIVRAGRQIQWALIVQDEVAELRACIGTHISTITLLLRLDGLQRERKHMQDAEQTLATAQDISAQVETLRSSIASNLATKADIDGLLPLLEGVSTQLSNTAQQKDLEHATAMLHQAARKLDTVADRAQLADLTFDPQQLRSYQQKTHADMTTSAQHIALDHVAASTLVDRRLSVLVDMLQASPKTSNESDGAAMSGPPLDGTPIVRPGKAGHVIESETPELALHLLQLLEAMSQGLGAVVLMLTCLLPMAGRLMRNLQAISWPLSMLLDDNIKFVDALGQFSSLPYAQFKHWRVMQTSLECSFATSPGGRRVELGLFELFRYRSGITSVISEATWTDMLCPGDRVFMSMMIDRAEGHQQGCHSCGSKVFETDAHGWIRW